MKSHFDTIYPEQIDVIVIGAGHAGIEAALASARMGCSTLLFTINLDSIGYMPCNPSVGGIGKGHIVREIDALGGSMGFVAVATGLQYKMLNTRNGPSVQAPRIQSDKKKYAAQMKLLLERQNNLSIMQDIVEEVKIDGHNNVEGIITRRGIFYRAKTVVITTGTYMRGLIHVGMRSYSAGRADEFSSEGLPRSLERNGLILKRLKTGTPARINKNSVDFTKLEQQDGDALPWFFSYRTEPSVREQIPCWLTHTTEKTHQIIRDNLERSPLYGIKKVIEGTGARYCPSLEDKIIRFPDKTGHHVFLEPEGFDTDEMYVNGTSNSLPEDVQTEFLRSIPGLENANIMRMAYAIEYDYIDPFQMNYNFECRKIRGLFLGGQINGTSGYEEAAAQGLMAGMNAALRVKGEPSFVLKRSEAYIGVMCDDLVSKGIDEPYRIFTSRAEHRMLLRYDNADKRLMHYGRALGLIDDKTWEEMKQKYDIIEKTMVSLEQQRASPEIILELKTTGKIESEKTCTLKHLLTMPGISFSDIKMAETGIKEFNRDTALSIEVAVKYEGYIRRHLEELERFKKMDNIEIPADLDIDMIPHLPQEVREKLKKIHPGTLGQARSIAAVTDTDLTILYVSITKHDMGKDPSCSRSR